MSEYTKMTKKYKEFEPHNDETLDYALSDLYRVSKSHDALLAACQASLGVAVTLDQDKGWVKEHIKYLIKVIAEAEKG